MLPAPRTASTVLMGGGPDVDDAFRSMIAKAGGGDFVVLRASGADGYNAYVYAMGGVDSVETLVVKTRAAAADPFVIDRVDRAEAIFIADAHLDTRDRMGRLVAFLARLVNPGDGWIAPAVCAPRQPLTFRNVLVERLSGGGIY